MFVQAENIEHQRSALLPLCEGNPPVTGGFLSHRDNNAENVSIWWRHNHCKSFFVCIHQCVVTKLTVLVCIITAPSLIWTLRYLAADCLIPWLSLMSLDGSGTSFWGQFALLLFHMSVLASRFTGHSTPYFADNSGKETINFVHYCPFARGVKHSCLISIYDTLFIQRDPVVSSQIAKFIGPTCGPPWPCRPQMGPMLAPWTLLSGEPVLDRKRSAVSNLNKKGVVCRYKYRLKTESRNGKSWWYFLRNKVVFQFP